MKIINEKFYLIDPESDKSCDSAVQNDYDPYTGKYAFCPSPNEDELCVINYNDINCNLVENTYNNLARSLVEEDAKELLARSLEMFYLLGYDSGFTNPAIDTLTTDIKKFLEKVE